VYLAHSKKLGCCIFDTPCIYELDQGKQLPYEDISIKFWSRIKILVLHKIIWAFFLKGSCFFETNWMKICDALNPMPTTLNITIPSPFTKAGWGTTCVYHIYKGKDSLQEKNCLIGRIIHFPPRGGREESEKISILHRGQFHILEKG
jgi:hypothetical protein